MLISHSVHRSLLRVQTFLGCERKPCMLHFFLCLTIGVCSFSLKGVLVACALALVGYLLLLRMAREDLMFTRIYARSLKYRGVYTHLARIRKQNRK